MEMYGYEFISANELKHHGILGQKWGKRNGPPYPLDASDHSAREKKAGWRKSLIKSSNDKNLRAKTLRDDHERSMQNYEKDLPKENKSRMTAEQRKKYAEMLVGAAAVMGVGAAIYFSYKNQAITEMAKLATEETLTKETAKSVMLETLENGDQILKQGDVMHRMSAYIKLGASPYFADLQALRDIKDDPFKTGMYAIVKNKEDTAIWIDKLKANGYDAIIDYFDKGTMADSPLILFDPAGSIQKVGETKVTKQMKIDTLKALKAKGITRMPGTGYTVDFLIRHI